MGYQELLETGPLQDEPRDAVMSPLTGTHAFLASRTPLQVDRQKILPLIEAQAEEFVQHGLDNAPQIPVLLDQIQTLFLDLVANPRVKANERREHIPGNLQHFDVVECGAGAGPNADGFFRQPRGNRRRQRRHESNLTELLPRSHIVDRPLAPFRYRLRDLHVSGIDEEEAIGRLALTHDHFAGIDLEEPNLLLSLIQK